MTEKIKLDYKFFFSLVRIPYKIYSQFLKFELINNTLIDKILFLKTLRYNLCIEGDVIYT